MAENSDGLAGFTSFGKTQFSNLMSGLGILSAFMPESAEIEPVPNSFPGGAPNFSTRAYLAVLVPGGITPAAKARMLELGWHPEQEGEYWVYTQQ